MIKRIAYILIMIIIASGCKKPYNPPAIASPGNYLVVEGVINTGSDSTIIRLSRTVNLSAGQTANPETGATVTVQSDQNNSYPLTEITTGVYASPGLNLNNSSKYRLSINTTNNQQYLSDFVAVNITPPIDSVGFITQANGIQLYVSTHDPNNNTHYYRWSYNQTWQFHSEYASEFITNGTTIVPRTAAQLNYSCFSSDSSSSITLGSSAKLSKDVIYQNPLFSIPSTSEQLESKYSIIVHQYALTSDAYTFWTNLKANTEQLGSIFDAQPSNINGNIHNVKNSNEPVIGYVSACTVQSKRIFILNGQLPEAWTTTYPYDCTEYNFLYYNPHTKQNDVAYNLLPLNSDFIPVTAIYNPPASDPIGFLSAEIDCVDCTIRGTTTRPSFWK